MHIQSKYILQQSHIVFKFTITTTLILNMKYMFNGNISFVFHILVKLNTSSNENVNLYYETDYNPLSSTDTTHVNI